MKLSTKNDVITNQPVRLELKQPDGTSHDPQVFITLYPIDSKVGKAAQTQGFRELLALREKENIVNEEDIVVNGLVLEKKGEPKAEIVLDMASKALARLIVDWEGIEDEDGNPIAYDFDLAVSLFKSNEDFFTAVNLLAGQTGKLFQKQNKDSPNTQNSSDTITERPTKTTKRAAKRADTK